MNEVKKIYIAGKITGDDNYKTKFGRYEEILTKAGNIVFNPAHHPNGLTNHEYMRLCFAKIDICDAIYMLPDWQDSKGAVLEHVYAEYTGKEIIYLK